MAHSLTGRLILAVLALGVSLAAIPTGLAQAAAAPPVHLGAAVPIDLASTITSYLKAADQVDLYRLTAPVNGDLIVKLAVPTDLDYDLQILGSDGTVLDAGINTRGVPEHVSLHVAGGAPYYIRIWGFKGAHSPTLPYTLFTEMENAVVANTLLDGTFIILDGRGLRQVETARRAGMNTLVILGVGRMWGQASGATCADHGRSFDDRHRKELLAVMDAATKARMRVWVGLNTIDDGSAQEYTSCRDTYVQLQYATANEVVEVLGTERIWNWYIPQEPDLTWLPAEPTDCDTEGETSYMRDLVAGLRTRPVLISPYWEPSETHPARTAAALAQLLECAPGLSHVAPQDGAGSFTRDPQHPDRPYRKVDTLGLWYQEFKRQLPLGRTLWANVETFVDNDHIDADAPEARIRQQVEQVRPHVRAVINFWAGNLTQEY